MRSDTPTESDDRDLERAQPTVCAELEEAGEKADLARALTLVEELIAAADATRAVLEASLEAPTEAARPL